MSILPDSTNAKEEEIWIFTTKLNSGKLRDSED